MGKMISFANQKGGVGKTTSAVNIAASLGVLGYKTLLVDLDPQGNATSGVGVAKKGLKFTIKDVLMGDCKIEDSIIQTEFEKLSLIPANMSLAGTEFDLLQEDTPEPWAVMRNAFASIKDQYDYIIVDCPPSLGMLTVNALAAADNVLIPVQAAYLPAKGLEQLLETVNKVKRQINPKLKIEGILLTMVDNRTNNAKKIGDLIRESYGGRLKVYKTDIPRSVRAEEMSTVGSSIFTHDPKGKVAEAYKVLTKEVLNNAEKRRKHQLEGVR